MKYLFILLSITLFNCNTSKNTNTVVKEKISTPISSNPFDKQGHRGCRGLMPENTVPAMLHALSLGVTTLEMDVVITKDNKVILSHEPFFNHEITTKPDGSFITEQEEKNFNIFKMTFAETQQYDVGLKPHPRFLQQQKIAVTKPSLAALFDSVRNYMMTRRKPFPYFNIETKTMPATDNVYHPAPAPFVELLMQVIKDKQMESFVTIQSFDFRTLQYLHLHYPTIKTAMLIEDYDKRTLKEQITALGFTPTVYSPAYILVNNNLIKQCHQQNIQVIPWTVNDKKEIETLKALGVDGIISDYPNLFNE
jgi:glycerophosphoryl diester phosphodiesterase